MISATTKAADVKASLEAPLPPATRYGDLVNGLCYTAFTPVYFYLRSQESDPTMVPGATFICQAFALTTVYSWLSYTTRKPAWSALAFLGMSASIAGMNLYQWPHTEEIVVVPQFFWSLLILAANQTDQYSLAVVALINSLWVAHRSPLLELTDPLPHLLGGFALYVGYCFNKNYSPKNTLDRRGPRLASILLAASFVYLTSWEILQLLQRPGYATQAGYSILRAGFFALVGLASAGAFASQVDSNERLEALVAQRTHELVQQTEQLRMVEHAVRASETAMVITDASYHIQWSNVALQRLVHNASPYGLSVWALLNVERETFLVGDDQQHVIHQDLCFRDRNLEITVAPVKPLGESGQQDTRYLVKISDRTAQRAREKAEKLAEKEALVSKAMNESMQTLSHELRTPLQGIMGLASLLHEERGLAQEAKESISMILASAGLLLTLINNLLDVKKCTASMMDDFQLSETRIVNCVSDAISFCKPFAMSMDVAVNLLKASPVDEIYALVNPLRVQQVLINLVSNAIKHSSQGMSVHVSARTAKWSDLSHDVSGSLTSAPQSPPVNYSDEDGLVVVSVRDEGCGIRQEDKHKVFRKFTQLDVESIASEVGQPSGTGLGLNLCSTFVAKMNGIIWVTSAPGEGASFSFCVPRLQTPLKESIVDQSVVFEEAKEEVPANLQLVSRPAKSEPLQLGALRVLVVDDTLMNLKVMKRMLQRIGIGHICTVNSGEKGLVELQSSPYELVITDLCMPGMDGVEFTQAILASDDLEAKPVVVGLTAESADSTDTRCRKAGMALVLHKPVTADQLHAFFDNLPSMAQPEACGTQVNGPHHHGSAERGAIAVGP